MPASARSAVRRFRSRAFRAARAAGAVALSAMLAAAGGCEWSTRPGLPDHVRTVSVAIFGNKTHDYGVETRLAAALRDAVKRDPRVTLVNRDADAEISGRIVAVGRGSVREDRDDRPATMQLTIRAEYSFYDARDGRYLVENARIDSTEAASARGLFNVDKDPRKTPEDAALEGAVQSLADEIVRRTVNMW